MVTSSLGHRTLLVLVALIWAVSWPVIKVGVGAVPPLWFACLRYLIAAGCLFAFTASRRALAFPPRADWPLVAVSAVLQLAAYSALTGIALTVLPPGRASVLAFSTPIWVVPLAAWWLGERLSRSGLLGVVLGLAGALVIASPSLQAGGDRQLVSYALLMSAAGAWAISIVYVRAHRFSASALELAPWQMLAAAGILLPLALLVEGAPPRIGSSGALSLAYVGPVATAFAYWAVVEVGRHFPASTVSMALLAAPGLGIVISALTLGEEIGLSLMAGAILIGAGIRLATRPAARSPAAPIAPSSIAGQGNR
jgi:drug/metabolite transporter (DMT)-like permease